MVYGMRNNKAPKHPWPGCRIALHVLGMGLAIGGGMLMLFTGYNRETGGHVWDDWFSIAFVGILTAG